MYFTEMIANDSVKISFNSMVPMFSHTFIERSFGLSNILYMTPFTFDKINNTFSFACEMIVCYIYTFTRCVGSDYFIPCTVFAAKAICPFASYATEVREVSFLDQNCPIFVI